MIIIANKRRFVLKLRLLFEEVHAQEVAEYEENLLKWKKYMKKMVCYVYSLGFYILLVFCSQINYGLMTRYLEQI